MKWISILFIFITLTSCAEQEVREDNPSTIINESVSPPEGQPSFPALNGSWIIDEGCDFDRELLDDSNLALELLRGDYIAEVAVICQTGISGGSQEALWWTMQWGNWSRLGNEAGRGLVWLIRPDVKPEDSRVAVQNSLWLYQNTAVDYVPIVEEAGQYANVGDFNGALEAIVRGTNETLREVVQP